MTTATTLIHHKPPPLKTRNDNPAVYLRTNNYYGSMGRPHHGRRKSAVELLQETKAFYVKTESVLDNKQEFKNAEHLHVTPDLRSPTMDGTQSLGHSYRERGGGNGPPPSAPPNLTSFPYAAFSYNWDTCPPYPHEHLDHLHLMHANYINSIKREKHGHHHHHHNNSSHHQKREKVVNYENSNSSSTNHHHHHHHSQSQPPRVTAKITLIDGTKEYSGENWGTFEKKVKSSSSGKSSSSSSRPLPVVPPPGSFQPIPKKKEGKLTSNHSSGSGSGKSHKGSSAGSQNAHPLPPLPVAVVAPTVSNGGGGGNPPTTTGTMTFTSFSQNGSLYSSLEKHVLAAANLPQITSKSQGKVRERKDPSESDSPPPLPPKSPRTNSKPSRPSDFPVRLIQPPSGMSPHESIITNLNIPSTALPPPPPRKHRSSSKSGNGGHSMTSDTNTGTVIRRGQSNSTSGIESSSNGVTSIIQPMTLPSPILPPTPPPDVVMESPMSDSGPIISPPPAFSTPVTPMLDRQNSGISDRSAKTFGPSSTNPGNVSPPAPTTSGHAGINSSTSSTTNHTPNKTPLSAAVSMSGVSSISSRSQSHGDDVPMRHSPMDRSRSRLSSSSPMSHQDVDTTTSAPAGVGSGSRRPSESGASNSVFSSNVSMAQVNSRSNSNSASSPSEEEEDGDVSEEGGITADIDGDDDDSSRAADDHVQHYLLSVSSSTKQSLSRNSSRKSANSADGVMVTTSSATREVRRSPSRGRTAGRKVSTSSSGGDGGKKSGGSGGGGGVNIPPMKPGKSAGTGNGGTGKLSKSITENFLCRVTTSTATGTAQVPPVDYSTSGMSTNHYMEVGQSHISSTLPMMSVSQQHAPSKPRIVSPTRRPILRSKSDLSHRYKACRSSTLTPGFTLVNVDLGPPPPVPLHNSISTSDFPSATASNAATIGRNTHYQTPPQLYHHNFHHSSGGGHYHQPQPVTYATNYTHHHGYHTLQPSTHYSSQIQHQSHYAHHVPPTTSHHSSHIYARPSSSTYENLLLSSGKTELDRFFDQLGLENKVSLESLPPFSPPLNAHSGKGAAPTTAAKDAGDGTAITVVGGFVGNDSPVFFSSVSSIDSCARKSGSGDSEDSPVASGKLGGGGARTVGYSPPNNNGGGGGNNNQNGGNNNNNNGPPIVVHHGEPSIVERNARVIKWIFNCRKVMENR